MCLLAVLGIALASYLAVSNTAMKLSNRSYAKDVSFHLAETGLERSLRMFSFGTYGGWTPDASPTTTARRSLTIASTNYGTSGITATVNLRVDHYNAKVWSAAATYTTTDMVWFRGIWFQCISGNTNRVPPNTTYWISAPTPWSADANYNVSDIAIIGDQRYVCTVANNNHSPPNASYWGSGASISAWSAATTYAIDDVAVSGGTAYRCIQSHTNQSVTDATYWVCQPVIYSEGVATLPDSSATQVKTQLRATIATAPLFPNALGATTDVYLASGGTVDSYNSVIGTYGGTNIGNAAILAGGDKTSTAVTLTSPRINGYVAAPSSSSSPYAPLVSYGGSAIVTSTSAPTIPSPRVDLTRIKRSPFIPQFDIQAISGTITPLPAPSSGSTLSNGTTILGVAPVAGTASTPLVYNITANYSTSLGGYLSGLLLYDSGNNITINGPVIINVSGTYCGMWSGNITINPGGSLELYFSSSAVLYLGINAGSGIDNKTYDPSKLLIASTQANNTVNYNYFLYSSSALPFYGTLYMPNAYVTAPTAVATYGAISAKNIRLTANATLHYDTALRTASRTPAFTTFGGVDTAFMISSWRELTDPAEKITLP